MTSSPPTLTGFNNNVRYRGMRFHIQTEDSGITRPHITTQLFADGGYVIKSLRTDYREYVDHPERAVLVHRLMRDQHRAMALDLRDGKLDATIDRIAPSPVEAEADEPQRPREATDSTTTPSAIANGAMTPGAALSAPPTEASPANPTRARPADSSAGEALADGGSVTVKSGTLVADGANGYRSEAAASAAARPYPERPHGGREAGDRASSDAASSSSEATVRPPSRPRHDVAAAAPAGTAASSRRDARAAEAASQSVPSSSSRAPSSRDASTLRAPSSRKPQRSARPPSDRGSAVQPANARGPSSKAAAPKHRVIPVGEAGANGKPTPSADAANRASAARRHSGGRAAAASGSRAAATQRPPSTQKSPTSRAASAQQAPSSRGASTQRPASSRGAASQRPASAGAAATQRPPSSRKPARAASRPAFTAAALAPDKPTATPRSANHAATARPPSSRTPANAERAPSSRGAATSSKRPLPAPSSPAAPSSRRAGRPSPILTPPKGGKSIFGPLPQESLDDAILSFAATVKNGPPTRGSK